VVVRHVALADPDEIGPCDEARGNGPAPADRASRFELPEQALPADRHERLVRQWIGPAVVDLTGDRGDHPRPCAPPLDGQGANGQRLARLEALLHATLWSLDVDEHRGAFEPGETQVDAGIAQQVQLVRVGRLGVDPDERRRAQPEAGRRQGAVRRPAAEPPAARVVVDDVTAGRPDDDDVRSLRDDVVPVG
jgi:hypothetical protein